MINIKKVSLALAAGVSALAMASVTQAQDAVDLSGETVEFVIPFSESGGSARWANFYAPLLSEALPGNPTVVVKYQPGAGSTKGANWFQEQDTADGTVIFGTSGSTQFPYLLGDPRVRYEYNDWQVVLASGVGGVTYLPPDLAEKFDGDADDLADIDFIWGSQGATRLDLVANLAWKMLGMTVEPVFGIEGRGDGRLMFERGEANIDYQTSPAYLKKSVVPMVEDGLAVPMMTWGGLDDAGEIIRDPNFPDLPTFKEVCEATAACETSGESWDAWKAFFIAGFPAQKMVFLPGSASADVVAAYDEAFNTIIARDDFAEISAATVGTYPQMTGDAATKAKSLATEVPDATKKFVIDWLAEDYGVTLD